jgi:hypothetical protein
MMKLSVFPKGLKARFFTRSQEELPPTPSVGDIILIRSCRVAIVVHLVTNIIDIVCRSSYTKMCQR